MLPTLADTVARRAADTPESPAFRTAAGLLTWRDYDARSTELAGQLVALGIPGRARIAVLLPDGLAVHVAFLAAEKAGLVALGIGPRAGFREVEHLIRKTGAVAWISASRHQGQAAGDWYERLRGAELPLRHHLTIDEDARGDLHVAIDGAPARATAGGLAALARGGRRFASDEVFFLNSTSGTTGMPKCVRHDQNRWQAFHRFAVEAGELTSRDVFMSVVPTPFGFGLWTSHFSPTLLGAPTHLLPKFSAAAALASIEEHEVSVLAAVTTQFIMMLNSQELESRDLSSLRVLFTGGESVPYERAVEFEERTGACVLQFYGSNETGAVSRTSLRDPRERRLRTAGKVIPEMQVRLFDRDGEDVTASGEGQPGCKGPTLSDGYEGDEEANGSLVRPDGWMLLGDLVRIDRDGYLSVVGRTDDFIIRGGKNISAAAVEAAVGTHPGVAIAAAVAMPDPVFGERVCVFVEERAGGGPPLDLPSLCNHLQRGGVSKELLPERLIVLPELPRGSGGKLTKGPLRALVADPILDDAGSDTRERV